MRQVAAGGMHSLALLEDGTVRGGGEGGLEVGVSERVCVCVRVRA